MLDRRELVAGISLASLAGFAPGAAQAAAGSLTGAGDPAMLAPGRYTVDADLTIERDLLLAPGAAIAVARGRTLTLIGDLIAPASHIFTGEGTVDLNRSKVLTARPEWWGAIADGKTNCLAALSACIAAHPSTALLAGDYAISDTLRIEIPQRTLRGMTSYAGASLISRILMRNGTSDVIQVGPDRPSGGPGEYLPGIVLRDFEINRSVAVTPSSPGREASAPTGLRIQYAATCQFDNLASFESAIAYSARGLVRSFFRNCSAYRSRPSLNPASDVFYGFYFDGTLDNGLAGGNASLYINECVASAAVGIPLRRSVGAYLPAAFADIFMTRFETANLTDGIVVEGLGPASPRGKWGNGDLHITAPILDGCLRSGLTLSGLSPYAMVDVIDPYITCANGGFAAIQVLHGAGQVTLSGGQLIGWNNAEAGGNAIGIHAVGITGLDIAGTKLLGWRRPIGLSDCANFRVSAAIHNPVQKASQAAVQLANCARGTIAARITGGAGVFPQGVKLDGAANRLIAIDCTGIDPDCVAGGSANKLVASDRAITAVGAFGSHLATGIMS